MNNPNTPHHRESIRLPGFDYSKSAHYFLTICCFEHQHLFGEVKNESMILNAAGKIAQACWSEIPDHFPLAILHDFVIMPNHVHGIIELEDLPDYGQASQKHAFQGMIPKSLASIVKGYKIGVTKWFRRYSETQKIWQRNYYEHIIRNQNAYDTISAYIRNNPKKWHEDRFHTHRNG